MNHIKAIQDLLKKIKKHKDPMDAHLIIAHAQRIEHDLIREKEVTS